MKWVIASVLLGVAVPIVAQVRDPVLQSTDPADRAMMAEVAAAYATRSVNLVQLNAILVKLPNPTPLRGLVQALRAFAFNAKNDTGAAVAAIEESLRLLPDDPRPKLVAAPIFTFSGAPERAADLWMEASREAPDLARMSDTYEMSALVGRLVEIGDRTRADRIAARMGEIGFSTGNANDRSRAALAGVREAVREGRSADAYAAVTSITDPEDLLILYIDKRYETLWPRIAAWAGNDLSAQSRRYLEELRHDWSVSDTFQTATPYARRLGALRAESVVATLFSPMFDNMSDHGDIQYAEFLGPIVARSLAIGGHEDAAKILLGKISQTIKNDDSGNSLNIDAAYLTFATQRADWPDVLARSSAFLAQADKLGAGINRSAVDTVRGWRACALTRLGQKNEAQRDVATVLLGSTTVPGPAMNMLVCQGDTTAARSLLMARLQNEDTRSWALRFVQPEPTEMRTPLAKLTLPVEQAIRTSPEIVAAAERVGRILSTPPNASMPNGFKPYRATPSALPLEPGET